MRSASTALVIAALAGAASADIVQPVELLYEEYVFNSATTTIDNAGMNPPVNQGDSLADALAALHTYGGTWNSSYASTDPAGPLGYFFDGIYPDLSADLVYDLTGGGDVELDRVIFWQYENNGGGLDLVGNHTRTLEIRINTEAQGSTTFDGPPTGFTLLPVTDGDADPDNDLGGVNSAQDFEYTGTGRYVMISITDNYYFDMYAGGDRVGLGEVRFHSPSDDCPPDLNGDGVVNSQDFIMFLNAFVAGDPLADWNDDGAINSQDFVAFLNDFVQGC